MFLRYCSWADLDEEKHFEEKTNVVRLTKQRHTKFPRKIKETALLSFPSFMF